jgi:hypothetical protein
MIRLEKDQRKEADLTDSLATQLELSQELARIALRCPTCRELFKQAITRIKINKKSSDFSSQEESQTFVNPNNNAAEVVPNEIAVSRKVVVSNEVVASSEHKMH